MLRAMAFLLLLPALATAADPFDQVAAKVNDKMVKIFGAGGFRGATNYSTGLLISKDGHFITIASQTLETSELVVHLSDGRLMKAKVLIAEPELDIALCYIRTDMKKKDNEPNGLDLNYFDIAEAAKRKPAEAGDWCLAHSNLFEIAMRDEPMSVMQGSIMSYSKLHGRRGIFDFPYTGDVYVVDAITNGPGAGGGALTTTKGELLGIIGREIKNALSETWINYAIPLNGKVDVRNGDKVMSITIAEFITQGMAGKYKPFAKPPAANGPGGYSGLRFVPNVLDRTPPYVDEIDGDSPAKKAGLLVNDLVSFIDGEPIYSIKSYQEYLKRTRADTVLRLEVRRGQNLVPIELKLGEWPKGLYPAQVIPEKK